MPLSQLQTPWGQHPQKEYSYKLTSYVRNGYCNLQQTVKKYINSLRVEEKKKWKNIGNKEQDKQEKNPYGEDQKSDKEG